MNASKGSTQTWEYANMPAIGLNHINLRAPDPLLKELRDFYCALVGLAEGERPPFKSFGYWLYADDSPVLHLSAAGDDEACASGVKTTVDHVAYSCTDFDAMRARLDASGLPYAVSDVPLRRQRQLFFEDPAGNGVELNFS